MNKNVYEKYEDERLKNAFDFCENYKEFITNAKTERETIIETVKIAEANGFKNLKDIINDKQKLNAGDKIYAVNMDKTMLLAVIGKSDFEKGLNIIGSHIDSPRLYIKARPLYEDGELCLLDTHYYGGIKKYQWTSIPLAIHGVVCKKDGTKIMLNYGENEEDGVVGISDLLPHLDREPRKEVVTGEELNLIIGSIPDKKAVKDKIKANILNIWDKNALYPIEILFLIKTANNVPLIKVIIVVDKAIPLIPIGLVKIELNINFNKIARTAILNGVLESPKA